MNKKLVALAIAGAFALPMTAQAQTANVTLYGRLNLDFEFVKGQQADGSNPTVNRLSTNSSRFGLRGTESLGGGLNAIFQIENSVVADASGGTIAGRETFVGLQGSWGTFKMGRFLSPYDDIHPIFGNVPTLTTSILSTAALWAQGTVGQPENGGFDDRIRNSLRYDSPTFSGFNFEAQYGSYENGNHAGVWSFGGFYNNGPLQAGVAYERHKEVRGTDLNDDGLSISAGYNFGMFRIAAVWERLKYEVAPLAANPTTTGAGGDLKRDMWGLSGTVNLGPGQLYLAWEKAKDGKGSAGDAQRVGQIGHGADTEANQWEISYTYPLSKRTLTYAGYVSIDNSARAGYTFNINPYTTRLGGDPRGLVFGMVHFF